MPGFKFDEWEAKTGEIAFSVSPRHMVDIQVSCTKTVEVYGVREAEEILLKAGPEFRLRTKIEGFEKVRVKGPDKTTYGVKVIESPLQNGELISDEKPPVIPMPEASNLLLKMREMSRAHHVASRMPVLEPEDGQFFRSYEIDDDDEVLFEEEAFEKAKALRKEKADAKKAKAHKDAEAGETRQEAPSEAPKQKTDVPPPDTATAAE